MKIVFSGDRKSKTILIGRKIRKIPIVGRMVKITLWDGYKSSIYLEKCTAWFSLDFKEEELNNDKEVREWLDDAVVRMYKAAPERFCFKQINQQSLLLCAGIASVTQVHEGEKNK